VFPTWKKLGMQPWRVETCKSSADPGLESKRCRAGRHLNPPDQAIALWSKRESQVQALDRTAAH
jgi:hypothetical protein